MSKNRNEYDSYYKPKSVNRGIFYGIALVLVAAAGLAGISLSVNSCSSASGDHNTICSDFSRSSAVDENLIRTRVAEEIILTTVAQSTPQVMLTPITLVVTATPHPSSPATIQITVNSNSNLSRTAALQKYNEIYVTSGWCSVWQELIIDDLVKGECADILRPYFEGNNILAGAQVRTLSSTEINYPACIQYGSSLAFIEAGKQVDGPDSLITSTDSQFSMGSTFTLYFRCEIDPRVTQLHHSQ